MFRKRNKRVPVGSAVLRFFICLLIVILLMIAGILILNSQKDGGKRPYLPTGDMNDAPVPVPTGISESVTETFFTPEPVAVTPRPTPEPTPQPTPEPTPIPTAIPDSDMAMMLTEDQFHLPPVADDGSVGITECFVSPANGYSVMELKGWGYANLEHFNGEQCGTFLIITSVDTGKKVAYLATNQPGISGVSHVTALCKNPSLADWRCCFRVSDYTPGLYSIGIALTYKNGSRDEYRYYPLGELQSFTVNDGEVVIPVTLSTAGQEGSI